MSSYLVALMTDRLAGWGARCEHCSHRFIGVCAAAILVSSFYFTAKKWQIMKFQSHYWWVLYLHASSVAYTDSYGIGRGHKLLGNWVAMDYVSNVSNRPILVNLC